MSTIIPISEMPAHAEHGAMTDRAVVETITWTSGHVDVRIIRESRKTRELKDLSKFKSHRIYGDVQSRTLAVTAWYGLAIDMFTSFESIGSVVYCCSGGGPCNPLIQICP